MTKKEEKKVQIRLWNANLKVRLFGEGLFNLLFWMYFPFITVYFGNVLGPKAAGLLMTVPPLFALAGSLLGGALADRLGRRVVMLLGTALQAVMFACFALSPSRWLDYLAFIGIGLGGAVYKPASSAMVADLVPAAERRGVFATFMTAHNVGAVLGPALGAVFFFQYRQELLWTCAAVMLAYGIALYLIVEETLPARQSKAEPPEKSSILRAFKEQLNGYAVIFRDPVFRIYTLAGICALIPIMQLDLYVAVYLTDEVPAQRLFHWLADSPVLSGTKLYGWLLGWNGLLFVLFILPMSKRLGKWKERDVFLLSCLLSGVGTFALGLGTNFWFLFLMTTVFTFGEIVRSPVTQSFISRYAPEQARGQYMGADSLQATAAKFAAPLTVTLSGWLEPLWIFGIILLLAALGAALYFRLFQLFPEPQTEQQAEK